MTSPRLHRVSRSETSGAVSSSLSSGVQTVPAYSKDELVCEGSELCFEEVRAAKYFRELLEQQEKDREHGRTVLHQTAVDHCDYVLGNSLFKYVVVFCLKTRRCCGSRRAAS